MSGNIIRIKGKISNIYLLNNDKIAIVDTGSPNDFRLIISFITENLKRSAGDVDIIVPTHSHLEHMGNAEKLKKATGAKIIFSRRSAGPFEGIVSYLKKFRKGIGAVIAGVRNNPDLALHPLMNIKKVKADIVSFDGMELPGHQGWKIIFTPGHSPYCVSLYNAATGSLISGDAVINVAGKITRSVVVWNGDEYDRTINKLRSLAIDNLYPAHGEPVHGRGLQDFIV